MSCRVGMSTNPKERIQHWMKEEGHTRYAILATGLTYTQAQDRETREAERLGCKSSKGGERKPGNRYSVYHVWGGR